MDAIRTMLRRLRADQSGATAIEYGLIAALLAVACITGLSTLGGGSNGMWGKIDERVVKASNKVT
ncbi:Flp family type IVb pilin [Sphingomonas kaistensis]